MIIFALLIVAAIAIVAAEPGVAKWLARGQPDYDAEKYNCTRCGAVAYGLDALDRHYAEAHPDRFISAKIDRSDIGAGFTDDDLKAVWDEFRNER